jgi:hypothetical protein
MKVSELFEGPNYSKMSTSSIIDSEIQRQHNASKKGMDPDARNKRSSARGFRVGFAKDSWDGAEGLNDADMKFFNAGKKAGEKAKKAHKGEIPPIQLKNGYGERRPNPAFNKVIKPYLDAFHAALVKEDLNEAKEPDLMMLVKQIAQACGARATSANTKVGDRGADLTAKLSDKTKEHLAKAFLKGLGFKEAEMRGTKGSTHGDFSSDIYGSSYEHPSGATVRVFSNFKFSPATFHIGVHASPEQLAKVFGSKDPK